MKTQQEIIPLKEGELSWLMHNLPSGTPIESSFGPGWVALKCDPDNPQPAIELLLLKRGILNQCCDGEGI
jgi:hypothetical protein